MKSGQCFPGFEIGIHYYVLGVVVSDNSSGYGQRFGTQRFEYFGKCLGITANGALQEFFARFSAHRHVTLRKVRVFSRSARKARSVHEDDGEVGNLDDVAGM